MKWLIVIFFVTLQARAESILIRSAEADSIDFEAFAQLHPEFKPFSEYQIENLPSPALKQQAFELYVSAKERMFAGDSSTSQILLQKLKTFSRGYIWTDEMRGLFFDTFFYLAQTGQEVALRAENIHEAYLWASDRNNLSQWPDSLRREFETFAKTAKAKKIDIPLWVQKLKYVVWNGNVIPANQIRNLVYPSLKSRLSLVDDIHTPNTWIIEDQLPSSFKAPDQTVLQGDCTHPKLSSAYSEWEVLAFYSKNCIWKKTATGGWEKWTDEGTKSNSLLPSSYFTLRDSWPEPIQEKQSILEKPLFWVGVAAVVAIAVKVHLDQRHSAARTAH